MAARHGPQTRFLVALLIATLPPVATAVAVNRAAAAPPAPPNPAAPASPAGSAPAAAPSAPPCSGPEYRQFDFWIGDWEVTTLDGKRAGWNLVQRELGGCALIENWTGARGSRGKSFNIYTPADGHWHEMWVDSQGLLLQLSGGVVDGDMVMSGETTDAHGARILNRITWHAVDEDHVRQHWQRSTDGGATWTDAFLGLYARKKLP